MAIKLLLICNSGSVCYPNTEREYNIALHGWMDVSVAIEALKV